MRVLFKSFENESKTHPFTFRQINDFINQTNHLVARKQATKSASEVTQIFENW